MSHFGGSYDAALRSNIDRYLELDTNDRLCYVGPDKDNMLTLIHLLRDTFVMTEPVTEVKVKGGVRVIDQFGTCPAELQPDVKDASVTAEEFFQRAASKPAQFTKIILKDVLPYFNDWSTMFQNVLRTLTITGKLLIIHRPLDLNTLPLSSIARQDLKGTDRPTEKIVQEMESCGEELDIKWGLESLKCLVSTDAWFNMVRNRFPPPLELSSCSLLSVTAGPGLGDTRLLTSRIEAGLHELSTGIFRYAGDLVEFTDRLVFLTAERKHNGIYIRSVTSQVSLSRDSSSLPGDVVGGRWRRGGRGGGRGVEGDRVMVEVDVGDAELCSYVREKEKRDHERELHKSFFRN